MRLILIRGLPGSGKTTLGKKWAGKHCYAADDFFYLLGNGQYNFDPTRLPEAHEYCQTLVLRDMALEVPVISVANTFTQEWELQSYAIMCITQNYKLEIVDLYDAGLSDEQLADRNTHDVPIESIRRMRDRYERKLTSFDQLQKLKEEYGEDATAADIMS
tara:strand:+ start:370 stop:849 length:480 start_codon:yes stop_codon:yes gene_type:complete